MTIEHRVRVIGRPAYTLIAAIPIMAALLLAAPAMAKEPTGAFAPFKQCPRFTKGVNYCIYSKIYGGEVAIGKTKVPLNEDGKHEITFQGGFERNESVEPPVEHFFGALNGETLSKTPQNVPGGLLDFINCTEIKGEGILKYLAELAKTACKAVFENKTTGVSAVTELAKPATEIGINTDNLVNREGVALSLPTKVKLENTFLGSECYIGSSTSPVTLNLTTGTTSPPKPNEPISGKLGNFELLEEGTLVEISGDKLVDNAFAVPTASGCGGIFSALVDPLVDSKLGLPSGAGHNTAIQINTQKQATAERVIESEK
jgi:hypothetical protein